MMVEMMRFIEFGNEWWSDENLAKPSRAALTMAPMVINTDYVAWVRRYPIRGDIEMCEVHMADRGGNFILDKTYEEMRDLLREGAN